jgi:phospholipid/cholesterol/gamma-HCH transport system substrate-binding protein
VILNHRSGAPATLEPNGTDMRTKANYFKLGLFVIAGVALILGGVVFFSAQAITKRVVYMETYLDETVQGLSVGSPVNYRGVQIGRVHQIGFVAADYGLGVSSPGFDKYGQWVRVVMSIDSVGPGRVAIGQFQEVLQTMVREGLRARLKSQALTGVSYLDTDYLDPDHFPLVELPWTPEYQYIPSAPSIMATLSRSAEDAFRRISNIDVEKLADAVAKLVVTAERAVNDAHVGELSRDVKRLVKTVQGAVQDAQVGQMREDLNRVLVSVEQTIQEAKVPAVSEEARALLAEARETNRHLQSMLRGNREGEPETDLTRTVANLDRTVMRVDQLLRRQGPYVDRTLADLARLTEKLNALVDSLDRNPTRLLFGEPPARSERVQP